MSKCKIVGKWWADKKIELVEIFGEVYALNKWNGESYSECWKCSGDNYMEASEETYTLIPWTKRLSDVELVEGLGITCALWNWDGNTYLECQECLDNIEGVWDEKKQEYIPLKINGIPYYEEEANDTYLLLGYNIIRN